MIETNKKVAVRAISGFQLDNRVVDPKETAEVPLWLAVDLRNRGKVTLIDRDAAKPEPVQEDAPNKSIKKSNRKQ